MRPAQSQTRGLREASAESAAPRGGAENARCRSTSAAFGVAIVTCASAVSTQADVLPCAAHSWRHRRRQRPQALDQLAVCLNFIPTLEVIDVESIRFPPLLRQNC